MKRFLTSIALIIAIFSRILGQNENPEIYYSQGEFDSDTCCWRKLANSGKYEDGANLIVEYLKKGKTENRHSLKWHAGQLYAKAENDKMAIKYYRKTSNIFYRWFGGEDGRAWYFYVNGNIAFLKRDKEKLERIINKWNDKLPKDINYQQLILLIDNWD